VIVLDENLLVLRLDNPIATWYPGRVYYVTDLQPGALIKDERVPRLLLQCKGATFVTTNVVDFWRRIPAHAQYGIICLLVTNERLREVPQLLHQLLRRPEFKTRAARIGKVIRVSQKQIQYYTSRSSSLITLDW
jgi:hypothetical protein